MFDKHTTNIVITHEAYVKKHEHTTELYIDHNLLYRKEPKRAPKPPMETTS